MRAKESQKRSCKRREKEEKYRENEEKDRMTFYLGLPINTMTHKKVKQ